MGRSVERPLPHYLPSLAAIPLGSCLAFYAAGRRDGGGIVAGAYILLALCGESAQLALYGRALLLLTSPRRGIVEGEWPRRTVLAGLCGYGSFLLLSWLGFGASLLGELQGRWTPPLPGLDLGSLVVAVLLAWTLGLCALWGGQGRSARSCGEMAGDPARDEAAAQLRVCTTGSATEGEGRGSLPGQAGPGEDAEGRRALGAKYGGRPLPEAEARRIVGRARALLSASPDLGSQAVEPRRIAERLGLPYYLLSRAVNEAEGQSLGELVNEYRIERAVGLLGSRPELGILDVALESGFQAKSTFNEVFRKRVGSSPSEYRARLGPGT
jgi:AraC-like DNA-binding protein